MVNEPERPIEKLLRAAAQKRREEAGAPFELHPANRRLLQGEVARTFARPQRQGGSLTQALARLWPQLAGGLALVALLGLTVWVLQPGPIQVNRSAYQPQNREVSEAATAKQLLPPAPATTATVTAPPLAAEKKEPTTVTYANMTQPAAAAPAGRPVTVRERVGGPVNTAAGTFADKDTLPSEAARQLADEERPMAIGGAAPAAAANRAPAGTINGGFGMRYGLAPQAAPPANQPAAAAETPPASTLSAASNPVAAAETHAAVAGISGKTDLYHQFQAAGESAQRPSQSPVAADSLLKAPREPQAGQGSPVTLSLSPSEGERVPKAGDGLVYGFKAETNSVDSLLAGVQKDKAATVAQHFVQVAQGEGVKQAIADRSSTAQPVLASFSVEQMGQELSIVDSDGSVYRGYVQLAAPARRARPAKVEAPAPGSASRALGVELKEEATSSSNFYRLAPLAYAFSVSGTNRSLNQKVVFTGELLATTNLTSSVPATTNLEISGRLESGLGGSAKVVLQPLLNSRISGKVVIGGGQPVEINALPATP